MESISELRSQVLKYHFRNVHPSVRFGTASDRYAGWRGQIYPDDARVRRQTRTLNGQQFDEAKVAIESVKYYFKHFGALEIDFTFYTPLLKADGEPAESSFYPLRQYARYAPDDAVFFLKAPQKYFARQLHRSGSFVQNNDFLDAEGYLNRFLKPATDLLGDRLGGIIFQQEYQRVSSSPSKEENIEQLDNFFSELPDSPSNHIELRSEHLWSDSYFDWLADCGIGHVFSHWTWLPMIREQWKRCGERFTSADGEAVCRLLTPRNMKYAEAYAKAHPFSEAVPELAETEQAHDMVMDATALAFQAQAQSATLNVMANNRAWGNAPDLCQEIANRILDEAERRER